LKCPYTDQADQWLNQLEENKPNLRLGIFGYYYPTSDISILEDLRNKLRTHENYRQTYLVRDLPDLPRFRGDNHLKSIFALEESHINVFVLTFTGQSLGVGREIEYVIHNPRLVYKSPLVIETQYDTEMNQTREALSSMFRNDILALNFKVGHFKKDDYTDLFEQTKGLINPLFYSYAKNDLTELFRPHLI
jgi:hypothetical protein